MQNKTVNGGERMKTIKQIADEIGVSKQAVQKRLSQLPTTAVATNEQGIKLINVEGEAFLRATIQNRLSATSVLVVDNQTTTKAEVADNQSEIYMILKAELEVKNKQITEMKQVIDEQQQTIKALTETITIAHQTLQAEQALHADTKKMYLLLDGKKLKRWWQVWKKNN